MPLVEVAEIMQAPVHRVWDLVNDVESYPRLMEHVRSLKVLERGLNYRLTAWEVDCKGFIMRWVEREEIDRERYRINYRQIEGDLAVFEGYWQLEPLADETSQAILSVLFEIGIPMLCEMLDPVAERAIRGNSQKMLLSLASEVAHKQGVKNA
jgi:coenzyme Q-binding protein COQ10